VKTALITGYTGQDGTFLTRLLLNKGYTVIGLVRRISTEPPRRVRGRFDFSAELSTGRLILEQGDLLSTESLVRIINQWQPDEIYNLAAQSHVGTSFTQPEFTIQADLFGVINLITALEAVSDITTDYKWRMYQASTSEMFGHRPSGQVFHEKSKLKPNSPYAIAKTAAHHYCNMKRAQGRFISCGILFNHESEIRGADFVTQKIVQGAVAFFRAFHDGQERPVLELGNLDAKRDWGYAGDYVRAMHAMLLQAEPEDYVIAMGETHSIRDFAEATFNKLGFELKWTGEGQKEIGYVSTSEGRIVAVQINPEYYRPNDVGYLIGNAEKATKELGWKPQVSFDGLVSVMVEAAREV
jgi:GDPmannose 4,6-dehydratase